jgi:hypothetical protein
VVRHQAVAEEPEREAVPGLRQGVEERLVVGGVGEDIGAVVAAVDESVEDRPGRS